MSDQSWMEKFAERPNIGVLDYPFVPVPIHEIQSYIKQVGFAEKIVDTIETIGYLDQDEDKAIWLLASDEEDLLKIKVDVSSMMYSCAYKLDASGFMLGLRHAERMVKIFGTLKIQEKMPVILAKIIVRVENVAKCEQLLKLTSQLVSRHADSYFYDVIRDRQLNKFIALNPITKT